MKNEKLDEIDLEREMTERISVTTFNVLAPLYFEITDDPKSKGMEESRPESYKLRHQAICEVILNTNSDIVCLQELWLPSVNNKSNKQGVVPILSERLSMVYDLTISHQRSGSSEDGLMILFRRTKFDKVSVKQVTYRSMFRRKNRVGLLALLRTTQEGLNVVIATTHLLFPNKATDMSGHDQHIREIREAIDEFIVEEGVENDNLVFITGDFNSALIQDRRRTKVNNTIIKGKVAELMRYQNWLDQLLEDGYLLSQKIDSTFCSHMPHTHKPIDCDFIFFRSCLKKRANKAVLNDNASLQSIGTVPDEDLSEFDSGEEGPTGTDDKISLRPRMLKSTTFIREMDVGAIPKPSLLHPYPLSNRNSTLPEPGKVFAKTSNRFSSTSVGITADNIQEYELAKAVSPNSKAQKTLDRARRTDVSRKKSSSGISFVPLDEEKSCEQELGGSVAINKKNSVKPSQRENLKKPKHPPKVSLSIRSTSSFLSIRSRRSLRPKRSQVVQENQCEVVDCYLEPREFRSSLAISRPRTLPINRKNFEFILGKASSAKLGELSVAENSLCGDGSVSHRTKSVSPSLSTQNFIGRLFSRRNKVEVLGDQGDPSVLSDIERVFVEEWSKISDHRPKTAQFVIHLS